MGSQFAPNDPFAQVGDVLARLYSADLRLIVTRGIEILDQRAGDCDLEDDDPAGDTLDEHGEHPAEDATTILGTKPQYGLDQSRGPVNSRTAYQAHQAEELGLVRTSRGTWAVAV